MKFTSIAQLEAAPTSDLIAFYNAYSTKPVKKFADRATALKRCAVLMDECGLNEEANEELEDEVKLDEAQPKESNGDVAKADDDESKPFWPFGKNSEASEGQGDSTVDQDGAPEKKAKAVTKKPISAASNAAGVAASWADPAVAAARMIRDGVAVTVKGQKSTHKSTREAFRFFRLLDSKHIRFRGILKASKSAVYTENGVEYHFEII